ncbi:MAG: EamA family transporter [Acidimicrobiales bacterium]|nr:EamA family transporter [Acidimicrobiales bacterium]HRW36275.1 EamA family transporter [Aquihabitans sp.]
MAIVLGLLVALFYGSGDFFGGLASKRAASPTVVVGSFTVAAVLLAVTTLGWAVVGELPTPDGRDLWLGAASGVIGPISLALLYRGLASGRMSVVAPITAVVAAIVPLAWGLAVGERPSAVALGGVVVALVAVVLIAGAPAHEDHPVDAAVLPVREVVGPAVLAGLGFGVIFILLGETSGHAGLWPLVVARPTAIVLTAAALALVALRRGRPLGPSIVPARAAWPALSVAGTFDITANATYLAAANRGLLSIVAVLSSLYPAATVVLARLVLGERLHRVQLAGLALAAAGIAAIAAG